jgi:hypothetical protein
MDVPQKQQQQQRIGGVGIDVVLVGNDAPADDGSTPRRPRWLATAAVSRKTRSQRRRPMARPR